MRIQVRLFALAKQQVGSETVDVDLDEPATIGNLRAALVAEHPELADLMEHVMFAVNTEYAEDAAELSDGDEVACIPPVSGG